MQGGFRSADIGRECLPKLMETVSPLFRNSTRVLFARFPKSGGTAADTFQRAVWTTFFNDYDFASYPLPDEVSKWEIRVCHSCWT